MRKSSILGAIGLAAMAGALASTAPIVPRSTATPRRRRRQVRYFPYQPAVDTGASPRATQRRASRDHRRNAFQRLKATRGSARQARRTRSADLREAGQVF